MDHRFGTAGTVLRVLVHGCFSLPDGGSRTSSVQGSEPLSTALLNRGPLPGLDTSTPRVTRRLQVPCPAEQVTYREEEIEVTPPFRGRRRVGERPPRRTLKCGSLAR